MTVNHPTASSGDELRARAHELARRWLPMLLTRLGVGNSVILEMRLEIGDDVELLRRLELARVGILPVVRQTSAETRDMADSALALIAELARGVQRIDDDPAAADVALARVNQHLLGLLAGLPSSTVRAGLARASWWSRLLSRNASVRALAS